jgi:cutinase
MCSAEGVPPKVRPFTSTPGRRAASVVAAILVAAILVIAPCGLSTPAGLPSAEAAPCPDVEVVFARGTGEPPGIGRVGQALVDALQPQLGSRTLGSYAVNYPASYDFLAAASGAADATAYISAMAQQCPSTRIVLGGYSQGAAVVDMLAAIPPLGDKIGEIGSAPPLPANLVGNVAAIAVFGNPSTKFGNPITASPLFGGRSIDLCSDGDPICSRGRNPFAHTHYESSDYPGQAAGFVVGFLGGSPSPEAPEAPEAPETPEAP